jgi:hypothetical protein
MENVTNTRLHAWNDGSKIYKTSQGNCKNIGEKCNEKFEICHNLDEDKFKSIHQKMKMLFPSKYRNL